jgi:hypothetical protein
MVFRLVAAVAIGLAVAFGSLIAHGESNIPLTTQLIHLPVIKGEVEGPPGDILITPQPEPLETPTSQATTTATLQPTSTGTPTSTPTHTPTSTPLPTATASRTPTRTPTATATTVPTAAPTAIPPPSGANVTCREYANAQICAWVSDATPRQYSDVTTFGRLIINGSPVSGAQMKTTWNYRTTTSYEDCVTNTNGIGRCTRWISSATVGYTVRVDVEIRHGNNTYNTNTSFTPRER